MKKTTVAIIFTAVLSIILLIGYTAAWHGWARGVERAAENFRADLTAQGTAIDGAFTKPSGFPGPIHISFSGTLASDGRAITLPELHVKGFFLPGTPLRIELPRGVQLQLPDRDVYSSSLDAAILDVTVPNPLPADFTARDLNRWREANGTLPINEIEIRKGPLTVKGNGTLSLDERLQPVLQLPAQVIGHSAFMMELQQRGLVDMKQAMIAGAVMNSLSRPGENNVPTLNAAISIQRSTLYVGPLRVVDVPPIFWPE